MPVAIAMRSFAALRMTAGLSFRNVLWTAALFVHIMSEAL
jgi:hypothetical protein